jgi:4-diphosphocytidyl-2-C-methyl-D-erythritol kinase
MRGLAYAKINLSLEIIAKRPDGYHELVSVMQTVSLADSLALEPADELTLECSDRTLGGPDNLVLRAARLLKRGGRFVLHKRIPTASGLGGGSSDGALALRLLDAAYGLGLSDRDLLSAAAELGSDVPFFLAGGTALVEGRGERVTPLADLALRWLVLVNPGVPLSTAAVYGALGPEDWTDGAATQRWAAEAAAELPPACNGLAGAAIRLAPAIRDCLQALAQAGADRVLVSGSGPTCFGLATSEREAARIAAEVGGIQARFVGRSEALALEP